MWADLTTRADRKCQLVGAGAGDQAEEFAEQGGMREDRRSQKADGGRAGGRVTVVPAVRGQGVGEPAVDVGLDVSARAAGELVAYGFVAFCRLGLVQGAELAQRLELVGAGRDPGGFAQLGLGGGGRSVGGELGLDDDVDVRVVDGARTGGGEQLGDALPLRDLRRAADLVGQVLVPGRLPRVEPRFLEGRRDGGVHAPRPAPYDTAADAGRINRLAGRGYARGERTASGAPGRPGRGHHRPRNRGPESGSGPPPECCRRPAELCRRTVGVTSGSCRPAFSRW
ncbi:hypothetical protein ACIQU4_36045 [Streptomyces sp. NPDC090741]|uniref:hypothetical protein n=1 Tax=Streptomyces sp. NPDC090741 TaxID=3365967 RepID=UPI0037F74B3D